MGSIAVCPIVLATAASGAADPKSIRSGEIDVLDSGAGAARRKGLRRFAPSKCISSPLDLAGSEPGNQWQT
jgi:hypothetical protein